MKQSTLICLLGHVLGQGPGDHHRGVSKVYDNRDNVQAMLKKLLKQRMDNHALTAEEMLSSGCWCQLLTSNFQISNRGEPVNAIDAACRKWHKCNQCTMIDDGACLGYQHNYGMAAYDSQNKAYKCSNDGDPCKYNACTCDVALASELADLSVEYDEQYGPSFDVTQCPGGTSGNASNNKQADQCCGTYPDRFPFASEGGQRNCCNGKTYDAMNLMCCADGTVQVHCADVEEAVDLCDPNPCENGGSCSIDAYTMMPVCTCADGFIGAYCETEPLKVFADPCAAAPCANGDCIISGVEFECVCESGWMGTLCEINPCDPSPCEHGACSVVDGQPVCDCDGAYAGAFCQISPCEADPCHNGGKCSISFDAMPVCSCKNGFFGDFCEGNYCAGLACDNGGSCVGVDGGAECVCKSGFTGPNCQYPIMFASQTYSDAACHTTQLELVFLIDSSGSARANSEFYRSAKAWIADFVAFFDLTHTVQVGLISFADEARVTLPLRHNPTQRISKRLGSLFAQEATMSSLNSALLLADTMLDHASNATRAVIVLSDFWSTDGVFPNEAAIKLASRGASVHAVGLGEGMMHLFAKLTALSVDGNMYVVDAPAEMSSITTQLRENICSYMPSDVTTFADSWTAPLLTSNAMDTAKLAIKYDQKGRLPELSRSDKDQQQ